MINSLLLMGSVENLRRRGFDNNLVKVNWQRPLFALLNLKFCRQICLDNGHFPL